MTPKLRPILAITGALLFVHLFVLFGMHEGREQTLASNSVQLFTSMMAAGVSFWVATKGPREARHFWLLIASGFLLWSIGQVLWTRDEFLYGSENPGPAPTDVLFFFSFTPMLMALLLRDKQDQEGIDWLRVLDAVQVALLMLVAYLFLFYVPERREPQVAFYGRLLRFIFNGRNLLIAVTFALRWVLSRNANTRSLYARATIFLAIYAILTGFTNYLRLNHNAVTGDISDLGWSIPFMVSAVLIASWESKPGPAPFEENYSGVRGLTAVYLLPTLVPFGVVAMSAGIAQDNPVIAYAAIFLSFLLYSARLAGTQYRLTYASEAVEEAEAKFDLMFSRSPLPIYVADQASLRFLEVNEAAVKKYGYTREEFLRMRLTDIRPEEEIPDLMRRLMENQPFSIHTAHHIKKDGKMMEVEVFAQSMVFANRPARVVIIQDKSETLALEEQLRQSQKMEAVGTLAGGVAHDFNNLLTVISGYTRLMLDRYGEDEQAGHQLQQVAKAADRAATLTAQLLAFSRRQVLQPKQIDLNEIIAGMERMLHRVIGEDVEIVTRLDTQLHMVKADPSQIEQVIMNLAANARDAMPNGGRLTFVTRNAVLDENEALQLGVPAGAYAQLSVQDTGCGMSEETQAHIFEPFFSTKKEKGTGLGLSTVYGIVKQSEGAIQVQSEEGQGSRFDIFLPRIAKKEQPAVEAPQTQKQKGGNETILVVEDDSELRELARRVLTMNGYHVLTASRGSDALNVSRNHAGDIHLMVSDVIMPGMGGKELAQAIQQERPKVKVLYVSGYASDVINERGMLEPGTDFLQKPFSPFILNRKVRELLDGNQDLAAVQP